jgi:GNAT superfamily N-acetyltransferase
MFSSKILKKLETARTLWAGGEYKQLVDRVTNQVMPTGNPVAYWDRFVIVELKDPRPLRRTPQKVPRLATPADIARLCQDWPEYAERFARRIEAGQRCFVIVEDDGRISGRLWMIGDQPFYDTNSGWRFVATSRPSLWCHDIFVDADFRMRGYFVALIQHARRVGTVDGQAPCMYAEIHHLNEQSIRAHRSFGYQIIRRGTVLSLLGLKLYLIDDEAGQRHVDRRYVWRVQHI